MATTTPPTISKCTTPSPSSLDSFSDYGSARRLTRKKDRVNKQDAIDDDGYEDEFVLDLDFDRVDKFDHPSEHDSSPQDLDLHLNKVDTFDDDHPSGHDIENTSIQASTCASTQEVVLDEWGFEATHLSSIALDVTLAQCNTLNDDQGNIESEDVVDDDDESSNECIDEEYVCTNMDDSSSQSSDMFVLESSQEVSASHYVHSQLRDFEPSESKRRSKPPLNRFVTYTHERMLDDDDTNDDDDDDDDNDDDDDDTNNDNDDNDDDDDDDDDDDHDNVNGNKCHKRKRE